jgi:hypothetical protein
MSVVTFMPAPDGWWVMTGNSNWVRFAISTVRFVAAGDAAASWRSELLVPLS